MKFDDKTKQKCAHREVMQRKRVYPRLVQQGKMKSGDAEHEIAVMQEIADEYAWRLAQASPSLL